MKKITSKMLAVIISAIIAVCSMLPMTVFADDKTVVEGHSASVVFVIDDTKSMKTNDKKKLTGRSVRQYIDILGEAKITGENKVGIVTFSKKVLKTKKITNVNSKENKEAVKDFVKDNIKQEGSFTNCVVGIKKGVDMLSKDDHDNKVIILVTDGEYDFDTKDGSEKSQYEKANKSLTDVGGILDKAKDAGIKIYTIKIEGKGVENDGQVPFEEISGATDASSYTAKNEDQLKKAVDDISKEILGLSIVTEEIHIPAGVETPIPVKIPDGVMLGVVQITYDEPIEIIDFVYDESGDTVDYTESEDIDYLNINMSHPDSGDATLTVLSDKEQTAEVRFVYYNEMTINATSSYDKGTCTTKDAIDIFAGVFKDGERYDNSSKSIGVEAVVKDEAGNEVKVFQMEQLDKDADFVNGIDDTIDQPGKYTITVIISGTDVSSNDLSITVEKPPVSIGLIILIIVGAILLIAIIILVILFATGKLGGGKAPLPFGRFQYDYNNYTTGVCETFYTWTLDGRADKKTKTVSVFALMNNNPELQVLQSVVFTAKKGQNGNVTCISNLANDCVVRVNGMTVTTAPRELNFDDEIIIEVAEPNISIVAKRI